MKRLLLLAGLWSLVFPLRADTLPIGKIKLPRDFRISVYASDVKGARSLCQAPGGVLFVGSLEAGNVYALVPQGAGNPPRKITVLSNLQMPNGVAFREGALYVAELSRVLRYDHILQRLDHPPKAVVVKAGLPKEEDHGWKFIRFGPDGKLYVPIGAPCNICLCPDPYGTITRMDPDGSHFEIYARGVRNTVGFDWDPNTDELWFTDNGRDWLGDNRPPDELNHAPQAGMHFGFPYCHGKDIQDPDFGANHPCSDYTPPALELGPHVASLGMRFYTGKMFPPDYQGQIFIAEHGSWNRSQKTGYRLTLVKIDNGKAVSYKPFAEGWLQGEEAWGRPVDVEVMPDGALMVSDDRANAVYRISYGTTRPASAPSGQ